MLRAPFLKRQCANSFNRRVAAGSERSGPVRFTSLDKQRTSVSGRVVTAGIAVASVLIPEYDAMRAALTAVFSYTVQGMTFSSCKSRKPA